MTRAQTVWTVSIGAVWGLLAWASVLTVWLYRRARQVRRPNAWAAETGEPIELTIEDLQPERRKTWRVATTIVVGLWFCMFFGAIGGVGAFHSMNALLDDSRPRPEQVKITRMIQVDDRWMGIPTFRNYAIEY